MAFGDTIGDLVSTDKLIDSWATTVLSETEMAV